MRADEAQRLLVRLGFDDATATPISGGWASWTFDVNGEWILRVARNPEIDAAHRREARLLPELARAVDFAVPEPVHFGVHDGQTYMVYAKLPGRGLRAGDDLAPVAGMLAQLHGFDVERAARLLDCEPTAAAWRDDYLQIRAWVDELVLPVLDTDLRDRVNAAYDAILPELASLRPTLIHRDLGCEHILTDPDTKAPTAIIDFETATVGDLAIDFVGLLVTLGETATRRVVADWSALRAAPTDAAFWRRLRFYHWLGSAHAVKYGLDEDDEAIVRDGVAGLRRRLAG